jgi:hypothetical protein
MTNTTELPAPAVIELPRRPHFDASRAAWIEHARITSEIIRRGSLRDVVRDDVDGDLILVLRSWSRDVSEAAGAKLGYDAPWSELEAEMGLPTDVLLSADGGQVNTSAWCDVDAPTTEWVRYERWTAVGRVAHGYVCEFCRGLTQAG